MMDKPEELTEFQDLILSIIEGFDENVRGKKLEIHLEGLFGRDAKQWLAYIPKLADKLVYPSVASPEGDKTIRKAVWDVKKKYRDLLKGFFDVAELTRCRDLRRQNLKICKNLYDLVSLLEKP